MSWRKREDEMNYPIRRRRENDHEVIPNTSDKTFHPYDLAICEGTGHSRGRTSLTEVNRLGDHNLLVTSPRR